MNRWMLAVVLLFASFATAQTKDAWAAWQPFLGTWVGIGSGQPGQAAGQFSFEPGLQGAVLVRHSYAE